MDVVTYTHVHNTYTQLNKVKRSFGKLSQAPLLTLLHLTLSALSVLHTCENYPVGTTPPRPSSQPYISDARVMSVESGSELAYATLHDIC